MRRVLKYRPGRYQFLLVLFCKLNFLNRTSKFSFIYFEHFKKQFQVKITQKNMTVTYKYMYMRKSIIFLLIFSSVLSSLNLFSCGRFCLLFVLIFFSVLSTFSLFSGSLFQFTFLSVERQLINLNEQLCSEFSVKLKTLLNLFLIQTYCCSHKVKSA